MEVETVTTCLTNVSVVKAKGRAWAVFSVSQVSFTPPRDRWDELVSSRNLFPKDDIWDEVRPVPPLICPLPSPSGQKSRN
jgi:hypothetical protein